MEGGKEGGRDRGREEGRERGRERGEGQGRGLNSVKFASYQSLPYLFCACKSDSLSALFTELTEEEKFRQKNRIKIQRIRIWSKGPSSDI